MDLFAKTVLNISNRVSIPKSKTYEKDGLLYCENCKTSCQSKIKIGGVSRIMPCICKCEADKYAKEKENKKQLEQKEKIDLIRKLGIPNPLYRTFTFANDDGKSPNEVQQCKRYVEKFDKIKESGLGLILWGGVGTGKTYLAMCIANALIDLGHDVKLTSLAKVVSQAQDFANAEDHYKENMRKNCIVLDDLGTERGTSFANEHIYKFIDGCNTHNIPLIITTNYTPLDLRNIVRNKSDLTFSRVYSRILEKCHPIEINQVLRRALNAKVNREEMGKLLNI